MLKRFLDLLYKNKHSKTFAKQESRFDVIIADNQSNYLETIYKKLYDNDATLEDQEILDAYFNFSDKIQTNTFAAAELELAVISVICHYKPHLTETLLRRGLLLIVYSLGEDIDWLTVKQFIDRRILDINVKPYGGLPPIIGQNWLKNILPNQKVLIQKVLADVIEENRKELEKI